VTASTPRGAVEAAVERCIRDDREHQGAYLNGHYGYRDLGNGRHELTHDHYGTYVVSLRAV
jgi:hypothetical protein